MSNLRVIRVKKGMSVEELALKTGVSADFIVNLESNCIKSCNADFLISLARVLNEPLESFF